MSTLLKDGATEEKSEKCFGRAAEEVKLCWVG